MEENFITWNWNKKQPTTLMNVNNPTLNTPYIISHFTLCHVIHHSFIWSWSSYPNKIKRCCYWGRIRTVLPRFIEKLYTCTGQCVNIVKNQIKKYLQKNSVRLMFHINTRKSQMINPKSKSIVILKQDKGRGVVILDTTPPRLKLTLPWWGGFPPRSFYKSASTRRAQLSVAAKVVRPTDLKNVRYWFTID